MADFLRGKSSILSGTGDGREVTVVIIPKEGKDRTKAKGWRPIVLIDCLLKLIDQVVVAMERQQREPLFPQGQYGSRKGKSSIDMVIQATTQA